MESAPSRKTARKRHSSFSAGWSNRQWRWRKSVKHSQDLLRMNEMERHIHARVLRSEKGCMIRVTHVHACSDFVYTRNDTVRLDYASRFVRVIYSSHIVSIKLGTVTRLVDKKVRTHSRMSCTRRGSRQNTHSAHNKRNLVSFPSTRDSCAKLF